MAAMTDAPSIWTESFRVRAYEVDVEGRASIQTLCNYLQEAAGNHAHARGMAVDQLAARDLTWVLTRLHLRVLRYPIWRQALTLSTWASGVDRIHAWRDFRLTEGGTLLAVATSAWLLIRRASRRPIRLPESVIQMARDERALPDRFAPLPQLEKASSQHSFNVRMSDLDVNRHVNHVHYIAWALESIPAAARSAAALTDLQVAFRAEAGKGDEVVALCRKVSDGPDVYLHRLERANGGRELATLRTEWASMEDD